MNQFVTRTVHDNLLQSERNPRVRIRVAPDLSYAGAANFSQADSTLIEQHLFVRALTDGRITRLLWVQFAAFPAPTPDPDSGLSWDEDDDEDDYEEDEFHEVGELRFLHDSGLLNLDEDFVMRPNSRSAHAMRFLDGQGYRLSGDAMFDRLTWLDEDRRSEMTILYSESLAPLGFEAEDLEESGEAAAHWAALAEGLEDRAASTFEILTADDPD